MKSLNSMFISVYKELLEPYGYRQVMKTPYFVNVVGDEIIKVISCTPRPSMSKEMGRFSLMGKITTTYSFNIDFKCIPKNQNWLTMSDYYAKEKVFVTKEERELFNKCRSYSYKKNDIDLEIKMRESAEDVKQTILTYFSGVTDISSYLAFSDKYCLHIFVDLDYIQKTDKPMDKALFTLVEDLNAYTIRNELYMQNRIDRCKKMLENGYAGVREEYVDELTKEYELNKEKRCSEYTMVYSNVEWMDRVRRYYQEQKIKNLVLLKELGILS